MSSSSKWLSAPAARSARKLTDDQKRLIDRRERSAQFLVLLERLIAWGYGAGQEDMVLRQVLDHFFRDLPPLRFIPSNPYRPLSGTSTEGARPTARSAVTFNRLLSSRNPEKLLLQATPEETEVLEACLPELLLLRDGRREAQTRARQAYQRRERLRKQHRMMMRLYPVASATPSQKRRITGMGMLHAEASQAYCKAAGSFAVADLLFRRARGLPPARRSAYSRRRYKLRPGHKRFPRWWERVRVRKPASDLRKGSKAPPRWRDLCPGSLVYMHVAGAYAHGRVIAFTLNLTHEVERQARSKPLPAAWLRDRIARRVKQGMGRPVEILVCIEVHRSGRLHAHGVMTDVPLVREDDVRRALSFAGGEDYGGHQVRIATNRPDSGWASYIAKNFDQPFEWPRFAATCGLRTSAEEVFGKLRDFVLDCRESASTGAPSHFQQTLEISFEI